MKKWDFDTGGWGGEKPEIKIWKCDICGGTYYTNYRCPICGASELHYVGQVEEVTPPDGQSYIFNRGFGSGFVTPQVSSQMLSLYQKLGQPVPSIRMRMEHPLIFITDAEMNDRKNLYAVLEIARSSKRPLLIIASDIKDEARLEITGHLDLMGCVALRAPSYGERRLEILKDISAVTGAQIAAIDENGNLREKLGGAACVIINWEETVIVNGEGEHTSVQERMDQIMGEIELANAFDWEKLQERRYSFQHINIPAELPGRDADIVIPSEDSALDTQGAGNELEAYDEGIDGALDSRSLDNILKQIIDARDS